MKPWLLSFQLAAALAAWLPVPGAGYTLSPSLLTLQAAGSGASAFLRLENKDRKPAAVEVTIQEHRKDLDGKTVPGPPADDDFIVYPSQLVMLPGDEVGVQVRWIGSPALAAERAYTLVAREVPVPRKLQEPEGGGIRVEVTVLVNYEVRLYVTPPGAKPAVTVQSVADRQDDGGQQLEVVLANHGTAHQALADMALLVVPLDGSGRPLRQLAASIAARDVPAMRPHLLAGERRRLLVPRPPGLPAGPVQVLLAQ